LAIKLIVTDLDGTLLDGDHVTVPVRNVKALRAAAQQGVKLAIASGRTWSLLAGAVEQLGRLDYAILANGASVWDPAAGRAIYRHGLPNGQTLELVEMLHREEIPFELYCEGQNYVRAADREWVYRISLTPEYAEFFQRHTLYPPSLGQALAGREGEKFNLFYVPPEKRERIAQLARDIGPVAVTQALENNMEFNSVGVNKGAALAALAGYLGLRADEVMAFGDADNDLEMLEWAGWSFAMENGTATAKAAAKHIAPANTLAGVGQAVEEFVLNA